MSSAEMNGMGKSRPLASLATLKTHLSIPLSDTSHDRDLEDCLFQVSAAVENYMERPVLLNEWEEQIRVRHDDSPLALKLGVWPILSVGAVIWEGQLLPEPMNGWSFNALCAILYPPGQCGWQPGLYVVQYRAGWIVAGMKNTEGDPLEATLPTDIQLAVLIAAQSFSHARRIPPSSRTQDRSHPSTDFFSLPPEATSLLNRYLPATMA
ncbi:hypothetical protein [Gluconobacter morbifer]|uniref:Uncharacterized protein n=1 Tax=Gluconobacter morbifer G707 TaxID=1088869 RepID=G6XF48_9PROT|nr:hypothetical protein [Gluconobacter morbifer]EHH68806.1 hypothetical protein GMO_01130 [Gluconobacter morbifer G707]